MELWDAYDQNLTKIKDVTLIRGQAIPDGIFHLVCDVIVKHTDGTYLLMQRSSTKHFGGMWEATAGGSALQNEDPLTCAKRELFEETGVKATDLKRLGVVVAPANKTIYVEFLCVTDCKKDGIVLQEGETQDYKWVTKEGLLDLDENKLVTKRMQNFIQELKR